MSHQLATHSDPKAHESRPRRRRPEQTPLYGVLLGHLESFLALSEVSGRAVPRFVERELRAYLECGLLQFGFVRIRCEDGISYIDNITFHPVPEPSSWLVLSLGIAGVVMIRRKPASRA